MRFEKLRIVALSVAISSLLFECAGDIHGTYTQEAGGSFVGVSRQLLIGCDFSAKGSYYASKVLVPEASRTGRWRMAGDTLVISWQDDNPNADERYKMWNETMEFLVDGRKLKRVRAKRQGQTIKDVVLSVGLNEIDRRYPFKRTEREKCQ